MLGNSSSSDLASLYEVWVGVPGSEAAQHYETHFQAGQPCTYLPPLRHVFVDFCAVEFLRRGLGFELGFRLYFK